MPTPHDAVFKQVFGQPRHAAGLLARVLPPAAREALGLDALTLVPGSFVDEALRDRHTDLLFRAPRRGGGGGTGGDEALVYLLLEHQHRPDPELPWRLLEYVVRIWARWRDSAPRRARLPPVVPIVLYPGRRSWKAPRSLHEQVAWGQPSLQEALGAFVPDFRFALVALHAVPDEALGEDPVALTLAAMKWIRERDFLAHFERFVHLFGALAREAGDLPTFTALVHYLLGAWSHGDEARLLTLLREHVGPEASEATMTIYEQLLQRGRKEGREEGRQQGRQEGLQDGQRVGEAAVLGRQLVHRFGPLPDRARTLLERGTAGELELWTDRVLTATHLHEVFGAAWESDEG